MTAPILILGMHRSGTSMLARLLQGMGVFIGDDLDSNFESRAILQVNEELLRLCGANWDHPALFLAALKDEQRVSVMSQQLRRMLESNVLRGFMGSTFSHIPHLSALPVPWGFKDPRTTLTLPIWRALLGADCKVIYIERHGVDVAASLVRRFKDSLAPVIARDYAASYYPSQHFFRFGEILHSGRCATLEGAFSLWEAYQFQLDQHKHKLGSRMLCLRYESLLSSPLACLKDIVDFIEIPTVNGQQVDLEEIDKEKSFRYKKDADLLSFAREHQAKLIKYGYIA